MSNTLYTWFLLNLPSFLFTIGMVMLITNTASMGIESSDEKRNKYYQSNVASILFILISYT